MTTTREALEQYADGLEKGAVVTHNGDADETYLDAYVKLENQVIR